MSDLPRPVDVEALRVRHLLSAQHPARMWCDHCAVLDALAAEQAARQAAEAARERLVAAGWAVLPFVDAGDGEAAACARAQLEEALAAAPAA